VRSDPPGIFSRKKRRESLGITTFADLPARRQIADSVVESLLVGAEHWQDAMARPHRGATSLSRVIPAQIWDSTRWRRCAASQSEIGL
jgi:hypothetical protein